MPASCSARSRSSSATRSVSTPSRCSARSRVLGPILFQKAYVTTYLGILVLIVTAFILKRTRFGLRLRSCGENPQAADSVGISVYKMRYSGVLISGALAGLGGLVFILPTTTTYTASVSGYGFLAMSVVVFGQWNRGASRSAHCSLA